MQTETNTTTTHIFEAAGLGKAPFRFIGLTIQDTDENGMVTISGDSGIKVQTKAGGSCAYCSTYITEFYNIRSADGKTFHVGCECAKKTNDTKMISAVKKAHTAATKVKTDKRNAGKIDELKTLLQTETIRVKLTAKPHQNAWRASQGATMLDWAEWMMANAGTKGRLEVAKVVKGL